MSKKMFLAVVSVSLGSLIVSGLTYGQGPTSTTTQSTTQTVTTPQPKKARVARASTVETTESTVTTTPATLRPAYDQAALKKMDDTLCSKGFDAKVGNDNKNICWGKATAPDIVYSCVWTKKGESAYPSTKQGPCNLDNAMHRESIVVTKADYRSSPPLPYGSTVECCVRAAVGKPTTSTTSETTTSTQKKK